MVLPFLCDGIQKARGIVIAIPPANCYNRNNKPGEGTCVDKLNFIWKDRKRILGMPISFTKYAINEDRLFVEKGLLNTNQEEVILYRVRDISLHISLFQRIFGVGSVIVQSSDRSTPVLTLKNVKAPREVKEMLHQQVEKVKIQRRLRVGEVLEDDGYGRDLDGDGEIDEL